MVTNMNNQDKIICFSRWKGCNSGLHSKDDQNVAGHCILWGEHSQFLLRSVNLFAARLVASLEASDDPISCSKGAKDTDSDRRRDSHIHPTSEK